MSDIHLRLDRTARIARFMAARQRLIAALADWLQLVSQPPIEVADEVEELYDAMRHLLDVHQQAGDDAPP